MLFAVSFGIPFNYNNFFNLKYYLNKKKLIFFLHCKNQFLKA